MKRIYFDISATTPIDKDVSNYMHDLQQTHFGNPSSIHREGQASRAIIEKSRRQISKALNCNPDEIIFTSSGTEANNMVLNGVLKKNDHFITSSYEHPAILKVLPTLSEKGIEYSLIKPNNAGKIEIEDIKKNVKKNTKLISIMHVNNELGTINDIKEISEFSNQQSILFHTDAVQSFGKIPINVQDIQVDFLSISAHKLYGPKGAGALYKKQGKTIKPLIHGGGQESNLRGSTENLVGIGGFGMAAEISTMNLENNKNHILELEQYFISLLNEKKISHKINGSSRIPGVFNITFPYLDGKNLVIQLDMNGVGISFGAACASGTTKTSNMLIDIGLSKEEALSTVRISFGKIHNHEDIKFVIESINDIYKKCKKKEMENV